MKKSKLSVGLVTSFIGALALTACNSTAAVTSKDNVIVDLFGYNDSKSEIVEIKTDLYEELKKKSNGVQLYYDAILQGLIEFEYPKLSAEEGSDLKKMAQIESEAAGKVTAAEQQATDNASSNGTSWQEEWEKILDSNNCDTEDGNNGKTNLKNSYIYEVEKSEISKWYYNTNVESLKEQYIGVTKDWKSAEEPYENVDPVYPYHVLHILVSLSADKADYTRGKITENEAIKLWEVVRQLIDGSYSFQEIAMSKTDDTGSKDQYGDVEIMSTQTSFYNEFKLGIYAYDSILSKVNTADTEVNNNIKKAFGLDNEATVVTQTISGEETTSKVVDLINSEMVTNVKTALPSFTSIPAIPFDVFKEISDVAKEDKIDNWSPEAGDVALPRNVLFNQFLNFHSPFVVTDEDISWDGTSITVTKHDFTSTAAGNLYLKDTNFKYMASLDKNVLCDKDGNVVIGVRSEAGIHFMITRESIYENTNKGVDGLKTPTTLEDYYTTYIPTDEKYPSDAAQTFVYMKTGVATSEYVDRANVIKNEITSTSTFDAAYDYRLYEYLMSTDYAKNIKFADEDEKGNSKIESLITSLISKKREQKSENDAESINKAWQSYLRQLLQQNMLRGGAQYTKTMLPTTCAFNFDAEHKSMFEEGGECYVK